MTCDVCGLPDPYRGQGDGIGSCDCPRCGCGSAAGSQFCTCLPDDHPGYDPDDWGNGDDVPWPGDVILRPVETIEIPGVSR
jgi:hypothetical protein